MGSATPLLVCNLGLSFIGQALIASLDESSTEASLCKLHYDIALDFMLRDFQWNFATTRVALAVSGTVAPPPGYLFAYTPPSNMDFAREILNPLGEKTPFYYEVDPTGVGNIIYSNEPLAWLRYTLKLTDATRFDPMFIQALAWRIAAAISMGLTQDAAKKELAEKLYELTVAKAKRADANEGEQEKIPDPLWLQSRL